MSHDECDLWHTLEATLWLFQCKENGHNYNAFSLSPLIHKILEYNEIFTLFSLKGLKNKSQKLCGQKYVL